MQPIFAISSVAKSGYAPAGQDEIKAMAHFEVMFMAMLLKASGIHAEFSVAESGASKQIMNWVGQKFSEEISAQHIMNHGRFLLER